ncbi:allantoin permease, putative [Talaromyces marneffei ATCC 18224]|uniref:Allantoin permease, putative n=1 Tax=Talaromyces marneffei (strain ATCC 18224 / CBS 334.59 / QM 7333) TaxID=441960 RepID=B6QK01_TALMQ|nr:allantoin permease, putative [Talaromyces marneffei ATCC 18224]
MILQLPIGLHGERLHQNTKIGVLSNRRSDVLETLQVARGQKIWGLSQLLTYGSESGYPENVDREAVATDKADVLPTTIQNLISRHGQRFSNMVLLSDQILFHLGSLRLIILNPDVGLTHRIRQNASAWKEQVKTDIRVEKSQFDEDGATIWANQDLEPTPRSKRNYHWYNYLLYFIGTGFNNWTGGSGVIGVGLGWKSAIIIAFTGNMLAGTLVSLNSKAAARYHIGFPAVARSVYGMWGSSYQVAVRAILAAVWHATKVYECASYLNIMMKAIFGHHFTDIPNHVPASIGYTTQDFLCYFLVWVLMIPLLFKRPYQMKWFFTSSGILSFSAIFGLFIYCMVKSGGRISLDQFSTTNDLTPTQKKWQLIYAFSSTISNGSSYIESIPDMARWAHSQWSPIYVTLFTNWVFNPLSSVLGILGTSALQAATGQTIWTPWDIMSYMLEQHTSAGSRFGIFLLACTWFSLSLSQNISSNMIPFGSDTTMLWPRHITMTRGFIIVHLLAWAICPWKIYASAETFF